MMTRLDVFLRSRYPESETSFSFLKLHNGAAYRNPKVSFIAFQKGEPIFFLKTVREKKDNEAIMRAHEALTHAHQFFSQTNPDVVIPEPLWISDMDGVKICAETLVAGRPVQITSAQERALIFRFLRSWLSKNISASSEKESMESIYHHVRSCLQQAPTDLLQHLDAEFARVSVLAGVSSLPRVPAHGDLTPSNVHWIGNGKIGLIDWDGFGEISVPLFDLFTLIERLVPLKQNFFMVYRDEIDAHLTLIGLPERVVPLLVFFYLLFTEWRKRRHMHPFEREMIDRVFERNFLVTMEQVRAAYSS